MLGRNVITDLQLRKQALVLESEVNRLTWRAEWRHLGAATGWINRAAGFWREANPWLLLLAPLAGVWTARTLRREGGLLSQLLALLKWIPPLLAVWRDIAESKGEPERNTPPSGG